MCTTAAAIWSPRSWARPASAKTPLSNERIINRPSRVLRPGMVLTIEPGLYVRPADGVPEQFHNIGIRIEDDAIVTATGCELITRGVPVKADEIEALMLASTERVGRSKNSLPMPGKRSRFGITVSVSSSSSASNACGASGSSKNSSISSRLRSKFAMSWTRCLLATVRTSLRLAPWPHGGASMRSRCCVRPLPCPR
jgi:hypothetical protein